MSLKPRIAVDWDGTCVEHAYPDMGAWLPGAARSLKALDRLGFDVVIFSCRVADVLVDEETPTDGEKEVQRIREMLEPEGLGHLEIWRRTYKPPALFYIDDRAIRFTDWAETMVQLNKHMVRR